MFRLLIATLALLLPVSLYAADEPATPDPVQDFEKQALALSGNDFAADLYGQFKSEKGNLLISPESAMQALSLTLGGARGATAIQMHSMMHIRSNMDRLPMIMGAMRDDMAKRNSEQAYQFTSANALWLDREYTLEASFLALAKDNYGAAAQNVDFGMNPQEAINTVNDWVEEKTNRKIKNLLSTSVVSPQTKLILTNAVYFKGEWKYPFEKELTKRGEFYQNPSQNAPAWMMEQTCKYCRYGENDRYQALAMPYKGDDMEMVLLLPRDKNGIGELEQSLSPQALQQALTSLEPGIDVHIFLPRFRVESSFSLTKKLKNLGMTTAFDPAKADFTGLTGGTDLCISDVIQKTFMEVDETGTEAAAATAVVMMPTSAPMPPSFPKDFRADHPSIFLLRDAKTGVIYFMGRMMEPAA